MTPCPKCNRHVREETCPFCGAECVHSTHIAMDRVARTVLLASALALNDCGGGNVPFYGAVCPPDASTRNCFVSPDDDAGPGFDAQWSLEASTKDSAAEAEADASAEDATDAADDGDADSTD